MKAFTINLQNKPRNKIYTGIKLVQYKYKHTNCWGVRLGYFNPRVEDTVLTPKFFNVKVDDLTDTSKPVDEIGIVAANNNNFYGIANFDAENKNDKVLLFLDLFSSGRVVGSVDKFRKGELVEGKTFKGLTEFTGVDSVKDLFVSYPTVLVLHENESVIVKYYNRHRHGLYLATVSYVEGCIKIDESSVVGEDKVSEFFNINGKNELLPGSGRKHFNRKNLHAPDKSNNDPVKFQRKFKALQDKFNFIKVNK